MRERRGSGDSTSPLPRSARNTWPDGISTTHPTATSAIVGSPSRRRGGNRHAAGLETREGRARAVDRVDDEHPLRRPDRLDQAAVLGVEGHIGRALGEEPLERGLGAGVDRERHVAPGPLGVLVVSPGGVGAEVRQHLLAQRQGKVTDELEHGPDAIVRALC